VGLLCAAITVYLVVLAARAVFSWFPPSEPGSFTFGLTRLLFELTEPVLGPVRRVVPPAGMFDLSFLVVFIGLLVLRQFVCAP